MSCQQRKFNPHDSYTITMIKDDIRKHFCTGCAYCVTLWPSLSHNMNINDCDSWLHSMKSLGYMFNIFKRCYDTYYNQI